MVARNIILKSLEFCVILYYKIYDFYNVFYATFWWYLKKKCINFYGPPQCICIYVYMCAYKYVYSNCSTLPNMANECDALSSCIAKRPAAKLTVNGIYWCLKEWHESK